MATIWEMDLKTGIVTVPEKSKNLQTLKVEITRDIPTTKTMRKQSLRTTRSQQDIEKSNESKQKYTTSVIKGDLTMTNYEKYAKETVEEISPDGEKTLFNGRFTSTLLETEKELHNCKEQLSEMKKKCRNFEADIKKFAKRPNNAVFYKKVHIDGEEIKVYIDNQSMYFRCCDCYKEEKISIQDFRQAILQNVDFYAKLRCAECNEKKLSTK